MDPPSFYFEIHDKSVKKNFLIFQNLQKQPPEVF